MTSTFDVPGGLLIASLKEDLKKLSEVKPPEWSKFVKTAVGKKKPPEQEDWWYWRAASLLRRLYVTGKPVGVQRLRTKYGGTKEQGHRPGHFARGSGSIIRTIFQQLETAGLVKKSMETKKKGRILTAKGKSMLDKSAAKLAKGMKAQG